ncbi:Uncharacterised protein [Mycobacteroides abscessus subsp. abscessus]|nr:Uncharacterised protein [Mycobacteroides abscessus subsp. abscessus]
MCSITFGTGLLLGWRLPIWRAPTLILAAIWNGLHGYFHIVDMDMANTRFLGPAEAVLLCLTSAALATLGIGTRPFRRMTSTSHCRGLPNLSRNFWTASGLTSSTW